MSVPSVRPVLHDGQSHVEKSASWKATRSAVVAGCETVIDLDSLYGTTSHLVYHYLTYFRILSLLFAGVVYCAGPAGGTPEAVVSSSLYSSTRHTDL